MKYRIWDKENKKYFKQGEWETYVWVDHDGKPFEMNITVHGCWITPKDVSDKYEVEYCCEVKDKKGAWVYIGDIVRVYGHNIHDEKIDEFGVIDYHNTISEIIGNKNENKELWESL